MTVVTLVYKKVTSGLPFCQKRYSLAPRTQPEPCLDLSSDTAPSPRVHACPGTLLFSRTVPVRRRRTYCVFFYKSKQNERSRDRTLLGALVRREVSVGTINKN